jgi:Ca2+-binding RTX toxin-like protein
MGVTLGRQAEGRQSNFQLQKKEDAMKLKNLAVVGLVLVGAVGAVISFLVLAASVKGTDGPNTLNPSSAPPTTAAADVVRGCGDDDDIDSDNGNDVVFGDSGFPGDPNCTGLPAGDDTILGGAGRDQLLGEDGNDIISGEAGDDRLYGGNGDDILGVDPGAGTNENGNDRIEGGNGNDQIDGGDGNDVIYGGNELCPNNTGPQPDGDQIQGGPGNDKIFGGEGCDVIEDGTGNDFIEGGLDTDEIKAGFGADDDIINIRVGDVNAGETEKITCTQNPNATTRVFLKRNSLGSFLRGTPSGPVPPGTAMLIIDPATGGVYEINNPVTGGTCIVIRR